MTDDTANVISIDFNPNKPQSQFLKKMKRFNIFECHRRAGKSYLGCIVLIASALNTKYHNARFAFVAPEERQGDRNIADTLIELALRVPGTKYSKVEGKVVFPNKASIYILGIKNRDALRGGFWDGMVLDEFRDLKDAEYTWNSVILPSLTKWETKHRQGWVIITSTPPQKKHYYSTLFEMAQKSDHWNIARFPVTETGLFSDKEIEQMKAMMNPSSFAIEYMCSHNIPVEGAYFSEALRFAEEQGRIDKFEYNANLGVYASFDIGKDGTAIWIAQKQDDKIFLIDYLQNLSTDKQLSFYLNWLKSRPYRYNKIFLPHDTVKRSMLTEHTAYSMARKEFGPIVKKLKREFIDDSITRVNSNMYKCHFNYKSTKEGLAALREYSPKMDSDGNITNKIDHNWASHGADSFRYLIQGITSLPSHETNPNVAIINAYVDDAFKFDPF